MMAEPSGADHHGDGENPAAEGPVSVPPGIGGEFVFPDWSPYLDLTEAARAYLRDPELALVELLGTLGSNPVLGFTLERVVLDDGRVWQEAIVCDESRLVLWHGEDVPDSGTDAMTSALRVVPLRSVAEVGYRQHLGRGGAGADVLSEVEAYILLNTVDEFEQVPGQAGTAAVIRHDAVRLTKSVTEGGAGQVRRILDFVRLVAGLTAATR